MQLDSSGDLYVTTGGSLTAHTARRTTFPYLFLFLFGDPTPCFFPSVFTSLPLSFLCLPEEEGGNVCDLSSCFHTHTPPTPHLLKRREKRIQFCAFVTYHTQDYFTQSENKTNQSRILSLSLVSLPLDATIPCVNSSGCFTCSLGCGIS